MERSPTSAALAAAPSNLRGTFLDADGTRCACGGKRRPGVVLFGEALPAATLEAAWQAAARARLFVVLGSSLLVAPANLLPRAAADAGAPLVMVNHDPTPLDGDGGAGDLRAYRRDVASGGRAAAAQGAR